MTLALDKQKSILNVSVSMGFKIVQMVMSLFVRRLLIQSCGNEVNGLNALYLSIIGFLAVAELGVGSAITFCMYKPIVEDDHNKVSALYHLFQRMYLLVGGIILVAGLMLTPFIQYFAKDYAQVNVNMYLTFVLMLVSTVVTYFFGAKIALFNAYKNNYISTAITSGGILLQYVLQIVTLLTTHSFVWYLVCKIIAALVQLVVTELLAWKKYSYLLSNRQKIDSETKIELLRNIKATFMHGIGYLMVNAVDSLVISAFVGVVALGSFSNYTVIQTSMTDLLKLVFTSLTSVIGHMYVQKNRDTVIQYCEAFHLLNFTIGVLFYLGYYAIINNLISILFGEALIVAKSISMVIALNGFVQFMRQSALTFRNATGTFYHDRWKPLFEGTTNLILSVILVKRIGVTGVIVATILTNLLICHIVEPYVLYKNAFGVSPKEYYLKNYGMIAVFVVALLILDQCMRNCENPWKMLLVNGCISVAVSALACMVVMLINIKTCRFAVKIVKEK